MSNVVLFGGKTATIAGVISGTLIAVLLPAVVLIYGTNLGAGVQTTIIILALIFGALIALTAAFFGSVIPTSVNKPHD